MADCLIRHTYTLLLPFEDDVLSGVYMLAQAIQMLEYAEYRELRSCLKNKHTPFCIAGHMHLHVKFHMQAMRVYVKQSIALPDLI